MGVLPSNALMRLHGIIKVDESQQTDLPLLAIQEHLFRVPHVHQGTNNPFSLTIRLWPPNSGELLTDTLSIAHCDKGMVLGAFVFCTVI